MLQPDAPDSATNVSMMEYAFVHNAATGAVDGFGLEELPLPPVIRRCLGAWWGFVGLRAYCLFRNENGRLDEYCRLLRSGESYIVPLLGPLCYIVTRDEVGVCHPWLIFYPGLREGRYRIVTPEACITATLSAL